MNFDRDTLQYVLTELTCKHCGSVGASASIMLGGPHFARVNCDTCGRFIDWLGWPTDQPRTDRRKSRKKLRTLGGRCELCLRHKDELPAPEKLEVHHVLEKAADDGSDEEENLRVYCNACHSLVNWLRTYFGHYHPEQE